MDRPLDFMARQLAQARRALRRSNQDLPDFAAETLSGTIPSEVTTITLLFQLVQGLVTVSHELSGVTKELTTISEENEYLREELHDLSAQLANLPPLSDHQPTQEIADLRASICDLSHRVSAPAPVLHQAPAPTSRAPPPPQTAGRPPSRKGKERAVAPPTPPPAAAEDPKYLISFFDTRFGKAFGDPEKYAKLDPN